MDEIRDIVIAGGGPAAVVLARRLHSLGLRVAVVARPRGADAVEGFSPRTLDLVARFCGPEIGAVADQLVTRRAFWNGRESGANREAIIDRPAFDQIILEGARAEGIEVIDGRVQTVARQDGGWHLDYRTSSNAAAFRARLFVEARGRGAPLGGREHVRGPALLALSRRWDGPATGAAQAAVASFGDGWTWFIRKPDGQAVLQIFVDAGDSVPPRGQLEAFYTDLVADIPEASGWLDGCTPKDAAKDAVSARHAGMVLSGDLCSGDHLRIGDAAVAIDPLAGHGVYKAIGSALAAVPVVNTLLNRPEDAGVAVQFYRDRLVDDFWTSARIARDFYAEEQRWLDRPFWSARRAWPDDAPAHAAVEPGEVSVTRRPVAKDGYIEEAEVLITPDQPRGVWHVAGLPAVSGWRAMAAGCVTADALAQRFGVSPAVAEAALAWFQERGLAQSYD